MAATLNLSTNCGISFEFSVSALWQNISGKTGPYGLDFQQKFVGRNYWISSWNEIVHNQSTWTHT